MQNLFFCVFNVVLDTSILDFCLFLLINFFQIAKKISTLFCMACLCMPWSIMNTTKTFWEIGKMLVIQFLVMEKCYSYNFHIWKITNHRLFMQFSVPMELHEKCMISFFPYTEIVWLVFWSTREVLPFHNPNFATQF